MCWPLPTFPLHCPTPAIPRPTRGPGWMVLGRRMEEIKAAQLGEEGGWKAEKGIPWPQEKGGGLQAVGGHSDQPSCAQGSMGAWLQDGWGGRYWCPPGAWCKASPPQPGIKDFAFEMDPRGRALGAQLGPGSLRTELLPEILWTDQYSGTPARPQGNENRSCSSRCSGQWRLQAEVI